MGQQLVTIDYLEQEWETNKTLCLLISLMKMSEDRERSLLSMDITGRDVGKVILSMNYILEKLRVLAQRENKALFPG